MPNNRWVVQREREELGQLIKETVNSTLDESLGYWFQKLKLSLEILERDGRFTKEGIRSLSYIKNTLHILYDEKSKIKGEKQNENA